MNKFLILITFILCNYQTVYCQERLTETSNYSAQYNLEFQKDSTDENSKQNEKLILLIGEKYSLFESLNNKFNDSLKNSLVENNLDASIAISKALTKRKKSRFKYKILKSKTKTIVFDSYFSEKFIYEEEEELNWKITKKSDTISGYICNLALTTFAGRNYKAWFTTEIPINDGPYKFKGLPGLIIKIEDDKRQYVFQLESFIKSKEKFVFNVKDGIEVSKKDFFNSYNSFKKNFIAQLSQRGIELDKNSSRDTQKRVQKSRNNEIEISY